MRPTTMTVDDLKQLIASRLDVTVFLDLIERDMFDLVDAFEEEVNEHFEKLLEACE